MNPDRWQRIEHLYHAALERAASERAPFLDQACAGDEELRREVESLLASHDQAGTFIDGPPDDVVAGMMAEEQTHSMLGRTLGRYQLQSLLGAGGMGEVYRARDTRLDRDVAVKILPEHLAQDPEAMRRFEREAKAVAALSHPNILSIFDFGVEDGISYAVMELLEGETLRARLERSSLQWREAARIAAPIADGLGTAHDKGIIHRDLKPENIFLTAGGVVKILDFGIARVKHVVTADAQTLTAETTGAGVVMGTISYMSPEQVRGERADAPSDIFSFGNVFYEMISGHRTFARTTGAEVIAAILNEEPVALTGVGKKIPAEVERVIKHCLQKRPVDRYQSARDLASDLRAISNESGQTILAPRTARRRIRPATLIAASLILLAAIALSLYLFAFRGNAIDSLAILPLVNVSGDANLEYLSDGITESLINTLSQLPQLRVMARGTAFSYKGKQVDPRQVGHELNVRAVFSGRLTQRGDDLTVQVDLVNVADGSQLWGERYNRKLSDLSAVEEKVAHLISEKLRLRLSGDEQKRLTKHYGENEEAHRLYLKGRHYWNNWTGGEIQKGLGYFEQALQIDPNYAPAWVGLADAYYGLSGVYQPSKEMMPKIRAAAMKALEIDDTLGEAHASLGLVKMAYEWKWQEAEKEFKRAIELNPGSGAVHFSYGIYLIITSRSDEALKELSLARELDPLSPSIALTALWPYYFAPGSARQYDKAVVQAQKLLKMNPNFPPAHFFLCLIYLQKAMFEQAIAVAEKAKQLDAAMDNRAMLVCAYAMGGRKIEAQKELSELRELSKHNHLSPVHEARIYVALGDKDGAFAQLQMAYDGREEELNLINVDPRLDSLRSDPRFTDLLRKMNLAP